MAGWPIALPICVDDLTHERLCPHGVLHPDPDSIVWADTIDPLNDARSHACDGCCTPRGTT
jgi:hypothetical protein